MIKKHAIRLGPLECRSRRPERNVDMKDIVKVFKALSDTTRVRILHLLRDNDLCVCEIMYVLGMEQSRVSHQMRVLRNADLAEDIREGRWIIYRIPGRSREIVEGILVGSLRERLDAAPEIREDARKLEECLKKNLRSKLCGELKERKAGKKTHG